MAKVFTIKNVEKYKKHVDNARIESFKKSEFVDPSDDLSTEFILKLIKTAIDTKTIPKDDLE